MIITVSGAQSTGKTTLLNYMKSLTSEMGIHATFYEEFIRDIFEESYSGKYATFADLLAGDPYDIINIHEETATTFYFSMQQHLDPTDCSIYDRSPIDIGIYLYMHLSKLLLSDEGLHKRYRLAIARINHLTQEFLKYGPLLFYTRPFSQEIEEDGFRPASLINQRDTEILLFDKEFLSSEKTIVLPPNADARKNIVEKYFREIPRFKEES